MPPSKSVPGQHKADCCQAGDNCPVVLEKLLNFEPCRDRIDQCHHAYRNQQADGKDNQCVNKNYARPQSAEEQCRAALTAMALPEVDWFMSNCLPAYEKNLDELGTMSG